MFYGIYKYSEVWAFGSTAESETFIVACLHNPDGNLLDPIHYPAWKYLCTIITHPYLFEHLL